MAGDLSYSAVDSRLPFFFIARFSNCPIVIAFLLLSKVPYFRLFLPFLLIWAGTRKGHAHPDTPGGSEVVK